MNHYTHFTLKEREILNILLIWAKIKQKFQVY